MKKIIIFILGVFFFSSFSTTPAMAGKAASEKETKACSLVKEKLTKSAQRLTEKAKDKVYTFSEWAEGKNIVADTEEREVVIEDIRKAEALISTFQCPFTKLHPQIKTFQSAMKNINEGLRDYKQSLRKSSKGENPVLGEKTKARSR